MPCGPLCYSGAVSSVVRPLLPISSPARETCLDIRTGIPLCWAGRVRGTRGLLVFRLRPVRWVLGSAAPLLQAWALLCAGLWRVCGLAVKWLRLYLLWRPPGISPLL